MDILKFTLCLSFCFVFGNTQQLTDIGNNTQHPESYIIITNLKENLLHHKWKDEEIPCLQKILDILINVRNQTFWATWVWDSMQSPSGVLYGTRNQLGNYEQCMYPPWKQTHPELKTQYCLADIVLTESKQTLYEDPYIATNEYISSITKSNATFKKFTWGLCLPAICKPNSIKKFATTFLNNSHLGFALPETTVSIVSCQSYNEITEVPFGYYATVAFIGSMILLTVFCTVYYENHRHTNKETREILIARAFSAIENTAELFKEHKGAISSLNCFKFLTACIVLYLHYAILCFGMGITNYKSLEDLIERYSLYVLYHSDILIDTFIMISGVLLINSFFTSGKPVTVNTIIRRYFRLTCVPMVLILYTTQVLKYYISGPLMHKKLLLEIENCRNNWWTVLLGVNNYVDMHNACLPTSWSSACDFHLTVLGTGLFWLYQRNRSLGVKAYVVGALASVILPTVVAFQLKSQPIHLSKLEAFREFFFSLNSPTYLHTQLRSGPYFIGIALGFLLSTNKPANYEKLPMVKSIIILTLGIGLAMFIFMLGGYLAQNEYNEIVVALYAGTNRTIWAIAIGIIIISCEYGYIPLISEFIHWKMFIPLNKLSFGLYLTHWLVIELKIYNTMSPETLKMSYLTIDSLGMITFCCGLSYLLWLVFEAPINNIVAIVLRKRSHIEIKNETSQQTEVTNSRKKIT